MRPMDWSLKTYSIFSFLDHEKGDWNVESLVNVKMNVKCWVAHLPPQNKAKQGFKAKMKNNGMVCLLLFSQVANIVENILILF